MKTSINTINQEKDLVILIHIILSDEYIELPFIPAYQRDNRFEHIEKDNEEKKAIIQKKEGLTKCEIDVARGYLNKKDTFCFKCIEPNTPKKTQQWFFNFLMMKDLNASYTFLSTCLVPSFDKLLQNRNEL